MLRTFLEQVAILGNHHIPAHTSCTSPNPNPEEPDQSLIEATGPGWSGYIGTPGEIQLCTPTHGPRASLRVADERDLM